MAVQSGMGTAGIVAVPIPAGGDFGFRLIKSSSRDYDFEWASPASLNPPDALNHVITDSQAHVVVDNAGNLLVAELP